MSALLFLFTSACLAGSAAFVVAALRVRGTVSFLLATYLVAWAELVCALAALSPPHLVRREVVVPLFIALLPIGVAVWMLSGRRPFPSLGRSFALVVRELRYPPLATLACAVGLGFTYLVALALFTPPNSWDAMWVWLARAAFWKQQRGIGYVDDHVVLNAYPPVASIGDLYAMVVAHGDRFVTFGALGSYVAATLAVLGIARRVGFDARAALAAALLFATLPVVVLQASGALIDLPVAAFLVVCTYFALGDRTVDIGLAGLAFALALGAKLTAVLALPVLLLVVLARPRRWRGLLLAGVLGSVMGSWWYFLNLDETGSLNGGLTHHLQQHDYVPPADHAPTATFARGVRMLISFAEAPGASGGWAAAYVFAAVVVAALVFALRPRTRVDPPAAALIAIAPLGVLVLAWLAKRGFQWFFFHVGRPDLGVMDQDRSATGASALGSYYGPLGALLLVAAVYVIVAVAQRRLPLVVGALAVAPFVFIATVAIAFSYSSFWGRLYVFPVALASAASAALLVRHTAVTWGVAAIAGTTLLLTLRANDEKPLTIWGEPRAVIQTRVGPGKDSGETQVIRFVARSLPQRAHIGLAIEDRDWSYPFFGAQLERTVRLVRTTRSPPRDIRWLVVAPTRSTPDGSFRRVFHTSDGWSIYTAGSG
jgi:hypothetical protein